MKNKKLLAVCGCLVVSLMMFGCGEEASPVESEEFASIIQENVAPAEDEFEEVSCDFLFENCKNSYEGRMTNFVCFNSEDDAAKIETLEIIICDMDENIIEQFEIENPNGNDVYCISPVLTDEMIAKNEYVVDFVVNGTCAWRRYFDIAFYSDGILQNVISSYVEDGITKFESVLAG